MRKLESALEREEKRQRENMKILLEERIKKQEKDRVRKEIKMAQFR